MARGRRKGDDAFGFGHVVFWIVVGHPRRDVKSLVKYIGLTEAHKKDSVEDSFLGLGFSMWRLYIKL